MGSMIWRAQRPGDHHAVVIEHGLPVVGEPHIALQTGPPQAQRELKSFKRVLGRVGFGTAMSEADRSLAKRGKAR